MFRGVKLAALESLLLLGVGQAPSKARAAEIMALLEPLILAYTLVGKFGARDSANSHCRQLRAACCSQHRPDRACCGNGGVRLAHAAPPYGGARCERPSPN